MLECMPKTRLAVLIHAKTTTLSWPCLSVPGLPLQRNVRAGEQRSGNEGQVAHPPGVPVTDIASGVSKFCGKRPPAKGSSVSGHNPDQKTSEIMNCLQVSVQFQFLQSHLFIRLL